MLRYLFMSLVFYWLFRFVFVYLVPIFRTVKHVKNQARDFQQNVPGRPSSHDASGGPYASPGSNRQASPEPKPNPGDYIDFEEVK